MAERTQFDLLRSKGSDPKPEPQPIDPGMGK
ncbi:hypothetical protein SUNI508_04508 [Seiridium unicorne]|uniref:Uncharacterized protein n=1 Tax=Seiridium unicorne TaxID=138068 RepID=A0ABR2V8H2_9PEZI